MVQLKPAVRLEEPLKAKRPCKAVWWAASFASLLVAVCSCRTISSSSRTLRAAQVSNQNRHFIRTDDGDIEKMRIEDIQSCTFEHLQNAFAPSEDADNNNHQVSGNNTGSCWNFANRIIRIPVSKIFNRKNMDLVGGGNNGGVYKAVVDLGLYQYCVAAIKTDYCFHSGVSAENKANAVSCIASSDGHADLVRNKTSVSSEYTGALPWYAQLETGQFETGLVPTWAVVVPDDSTNNKMQVWSTANETKPFIEGAVMPFLSFTTIQGYWKSHGMHTMSPRQVAEIMLSAAKGLAFYHKLGLVHQDVHDKNMGLELDENGQLRAFLFDNTFLSLADRKFVEKNGPCALVQDSASFFEPCQFCPDPALSTYVRAEKLLENVGPMGTDVSHFLRTMTGMMSYNHPEFVQFKASLDESKTMQQVVDTIRMFLEGPSS